MRGKFVIAVLMVMMLMVPVQANTGVSAMQTGQQEDPRQPNNMSNTSTYTTMELQLHGLISMRPTTEMTWKASTERKAIEM